MWKRISSENSGGFFLLTLSHGFAHVFVASLAPLLPLIKEEFRLSYTAIGGLTFVLSLCFAVASIPAGLISDRANRIKLILSMFSLAGLFCSFIIFASSYLTVLIFLMLLFLSMGIYHPSAYPYLSDKYSQKKGNKFGFFEAGGGTGRLLGPLLAGMIGSYLGWRSVYIFWAILAFFTVFLFYQFFRYNEDKTEQSRNKTNRKAEVKKFTSRKSISHFPHLKKVYLISGFFGFIAGGSIAFLPLFLTDVRNLPVSIAGGMLTLFLAGGLLGNMIGGKFSDIWGPKKILQISFFATFFLLFLIPLTPGFLIILVLLPAGVLFFMTLPALSVLIGETETKDLGLAFGMQTLTGAGFGAFSRLLSGLISDFLGVQYIFFLLSLAAILGASFTYFSFER